MFPVLRAAAIQLLRLGFLSFFARAVVSTAFYRYAARRSRAWKLKLFEGEGIVLILTRRIGESLQIGNDVSVRVLAVAGAQVRLGVDAPRHVEVHREEVFKRIIEERSGARCDRADDEGRVL